MTQHGADSEVGRLQTVMLHRPGPELKRLTPRNNDKLLFDGIPWVARAQDEHDAFAAALRERDVEVLYLTDLLTETLETEVARNHAITTALAGLHLGDTMRNYLSRFLRDASPEELTGYLTAGIRNDEVRGGFGLVTSLFASDDFLIDSGSEDAVDHPIGAQAADRREAQTGNGLGSPVNGFIATAVSFHLGRHELRDLTMVSRGGTEQTSKLIGGAVLSRFTVTFDYPHARMFLAPRTER